MNRCNLSWKLFVFFASFCAILPVVRAEAQPASQPTSKNQKKPTQTNPSPASQTSYSPFDAIAQKLTSDTFDQTALTGCDEKNDTGNPVTVTFEDVVTSFVQHAGSAEATCIIARIAKAHTGSPTSGELQTDGNAVIHCCR